MGVFYQAFVFLAKTTSAQDVVPVVNRTFEEHGGMVDESSMFLLNDVGGTEFEPEEALDRADALKKLQKLTSHPTLGSVEYLIVNVAPLVTFLSCDCDGIDAIKISIGGRTFERLEESSKQLIQTVIKKLHETLSARRTIMECALSNKGFRWEEEVARVRKGEYTNSYKIIDTSERGR